MGPTPIEDGILGYVAEVDAQRRLSTKATLVSGAGDGNAATVDSSGRVLTKAYAACASRQIFTTYLGFGPGNAATLNARQDRCAGMVLMNTGGNVAYVRFAASNPNLQDLQLAPGEKFTVPFASSTEVRFISFAGISTAVAIEPVEV